MIERLPGDTRPIKEPCETWWQKQCWIYRNISAVYYGTRPYTTTEKLSIAGNLLYSVLKGTGLIRACPDALYTFRSRLQSLIHEMQDEFGTDGEQWTAPESWEDDGT